MSDKTKASDLLHVCCVCKELGATVFHGFVTHRTEDWRHPDCVPQAAQQPPDWAMRAADADTVKEWWVLEVHQKDDDDGFWWPMGGEKHSLAEVEEYRDVVAKAKLKKSTKFRIAYYRTTRQLVAAIISKHALQAPDSAPMRGETPSTTMKLKQVAHLEPKLALIEMVGHGNTLERELNEAVGALKRSDKLLTEVIRHVGLPSVIDAGSALGVTHLGLAQHLQDCRAILQKHQSEKRPSNEIT